MSLLVPAGNASTWTGPTGNNTWLLQGRVPTLIDAGAGAPDHIDALQRALEGKPLLLVLVTHSHVDHLSGWSTLHAHWPDASMRIHPGVQHRERVAAGDTELTVIHTPGHAPDHCCFFDEGSGDLYCGDLARMGGTVVIPAARGGNLRQYLESLRLVAALNPKRLLPGHGPIVADPGALIDQYLRHRAERDEQIVAAVRQGARTPGEIVRAVYPRLALELEPAAEQTVVAHLIKLRDEGRVRQEPGEADGVTSASWTYVG
jgi:glyoxylase-like metal-dependent hydrolase (beta-lactamase superfamily II)